MSDTTTRRRVLAATGGALAGLTAATGLGAAGDGDDRPGNSGDHRREDDPGRGRSGNRGEGEGDDRGEGDGRDGDRGRDGTDGDDRGDRGGGSEDRGRGDDSDGDDSSGDTGDDSPPTVAVERSTDGSAFTGGQTNQVELAVEASEPVVVRDRVPESWAVVAGDPHATSDGEDGTYVTFEHATGDGTRGYLAEAPSGATETGRYSFGPVEVSTGDEGEWRTVDDTSADVVVVGAST